MTNAAVVPAQAQNSRWLFISLVSLSLTALGIWRLTEFFLSDQQKDDEEEDEEKKNQLGLISLQTP